MIPTTDHRTLFTPSSLSENISLTPKGYLLCRNVPIARTGTQDYLASDFNDQLLGDPSGKIIVERTDEVRRLKTRQKILTVFICVNLRIAVLAT